MMNRIETIGKKTANGTIVITAGVVGGMAHLLGFTAACGELVCMGVRVGAERIENFADDILENGGIFTIDEKKSEEKAEIILEQYE